MKTPRRRLALIIAIALVGVALIAVEGVLSIHRTVSKRIVSRSAGRDRRNRRLPLLEPRITYAPRQMSLDNSPWDPALSLEPWSRDASLAVISERWYRLDQRRVEIIESRLSDVTRPPDSMISLLFSRTGLVS